ncbi:MAG: long-chain fatty acid--CoA ligase, partial [Gloeomargaritaceae cyanobacterium C42_A2020_066]|nr:long-chain fatty acid--CoA ligase [Gloeomargaritaceae cyanobacterium C42_A2020_066]
ESLTTESLSLNSPEVLALYRQELKTWSQQRANVRPYEQIGPFRLLEEPFSLENGLLTQTLKVKRNVVMERYQAMINEMFS